MSLIKCSECGQEISTEAEVCPHCGKPNSPIVLEKEKDDGNAVSKAVKFIISIILLWLLLFFLIPKFESFFTNKNPLGNVTPAQNVSGVSKEQQEKTYQEVLAERQKKAEEIRNALEGQKSPETIIKKVGDSFVLWYMEYQVVSVAIFNPSYDFQKTSGKYIGVKIKVTNTGKTEAGMNKIYIKDSKGRMYEPKMLGYQQLGVIDYGWEKIQAGMSETTGAIFEVPNDSTGLVLEYPSAQGTVVASVTLGL
jgi:DNA-directed RNA polymerase subunit RPC12/RpoP